MPRAVLLFWPGTLGAHPSLPPSTMPTCEHFLTKGRCKFGASCKDTHDRTLAMCAFSLHPHPLAPELSAAAKRKKRFCDVCEKKMKANGGTPYRCATGCDYDLCANCFDGCADVEPYVPEELQPPPQQQQQQQQQQQHGQGLAPQSTQGRKQGQKQPQQPPQLPRQGQKPGRGKKPGRGQQDQGQQQPQQPQPQQLRVASTVVVEEYQQAWAVRFNRIRNTLLGPSSSLQDVTSIVEHVGTWCGVVWCGVV